MNVYILFCFSNINDSRQFLHMVQKQITLFEGLFVKIVPLIHSFWFYDSLYFIDLTSDSSSRNQLRKFTFLI